MAKARHRQYLGDVSVKDSKLVTAKLIDIPVHESKASETVQIKINLYKLPIEEWYHLPQKTLRNDLRLFNGQTVSILRNQSRTLCGQDGRPNHPTFSLLTGSASRLIFQEI